MDVIARVDFEDFKPWSGAVDTWDRLERENKISDLEYYLEDLYPNGIDETTLNDLLWFDEDTVYEWVGLPSERLLTEAIEEKQEELDTLLAEWAEILEDEDYTEEERKQSWEIDYKDRTEELKDEIKELEEQLAEL